MDVPFLAKNAELSLPLTELRVITCIWFFSNALPMANHQ